MLRFNKSTVLGLYAMLDLARLGEEPCTAAEIAERHGFSVHHLAKVLRELVRRGFLATTRGVRGGYRLARDPRNVSLLDVVEVFEGPRREGGDCLLETPHPACEPAGRCGLHGVFHELDEQVAFTLDSISLATVLKNEQRAR